MKDAFIILMCFLLVFDMVLRCAGKNFTKLEILAIAINGAVIVFGVVAFFQEGR